MLAETFFENLVTERKQLQVIVSEAKPTESEIEKSGSDSPIVSDASIGIVFLSGFICFLMLSKARKAREDNKEYISNNPKDFSQVPCQDFRFFSHNHYLKCVVHPTFVLTQEAADCPDYKPPNNRFSRQKSSCYKRSSEIPII